MRDFVRARVVHAKLLVRGLPPSAKMRQIGRPVVITCRSLRLGHCSFITFGLIFLSAVASMRLEVIIFLLIKALVNLKGVARSSEKEEVMTRERYSV